MAIATKAQIIEALSKLDTQTDEHWTSEGQPKVETVASFIGEGGTVARKDIIDAAPTFSRTAPSLGSAEPPFDPEVDAAERAEAKSKLEVLNEQIADIDNKVGALKSARIKLQAEADDIIASRSKDKSQAHTHNIKRYLAQSKRTKLDRVRGGVDPKKAAGARARKPEEAAA